MGTSCYNQVWPSKFGTNFFTFPLFFVLITQIEACNVIGLNVRSQRIDYRGDAFNWFYSMYSTWCSNIICWRCRMHSKLVKRDIVQHSENHQTQFNDWGMKLQPSPSFMAHLEPVLTRILAGVFLESVESEQGGRTSLCW